MNPDGQHPTPPKLPPPPHGGTEAIVGALVVTVLGLAAWKLIELVIGLWP